MFKRLPGTEDMDPFEVFRYHFNEWFNELFCPRILKRIWFVWLIVIIVYLRQATIFVSELAHRPTYVCNDSGECFSEN